MSKSIDTLVTDIYGLLDKGVDFTPDPDSLKKFTDNMAQHMHSTLASSNRPREKGKLWFSDLGEKCGRKTWYKWNSNQMVEPLAGHTIHKFMYGDLIEEQVLFLAREAGHIVEREQERVSHDFANGWTLSGRIDAVIDGVLVDVKSVSSYGYKKYTSEGLLPTNDSFGYRYQLGGYSAFLPDILSEGEPSIVFVDKQNGHINVVTPTIPTPQEIELDVEQVVYTVGTKSVSKIARGYTDEPFGKSGNRKLGIECSYCPYKKECWPGLRTFIYSYGPVHMTEVNNEPKVPEVLDE